MVRGVSVLVESTRRLGESGHHDDNLLADIQLTTEVTKHIHVACVHVIFLYMDVSNTNYTTLMDTCTYTIRDLFFVICSMYLPIPLYRQWNLPTCP